MISVNFFISADDLRVDLVKEENEFSNSLLFSPSLFLYFWILISDFSCW